MVNCTLNIFSFKTEQQRPAMSKAEVIHIPHTDCYVNIFCILENLHYLWTKGEQNRSLCMIYVLCNWTLSNKKKESLR